MAEEPRLLQKWKDQSKIPGFRFEQINMLSAPRGVTFRCELTGAHASVRLVTPQVTLYYASKQDAILSWNGVMHKVLPLVSQLRAKPEIIGSEEERQKREEATSELKLELTALAKDIAEKFLVKGQFELGLPGAMQNMIYSKDLYGGEALEVVPAYLLLARCHLGLKNVRSCTEFLGLANWAVLKHSDCSDSVKADLNRTFGQLHMLQQLYAEAISFFAKAAFWSSKAYGARSVHTALIYHDLGEAFDLQKRHSEAAVFHGKVLEIWLNFFKEAPERTHQTTDSNLNEHGYNVFLKIFEFAQRQQFPEEDLFFGKVSHSLAISRIQLGREIEQAKSDLRRSMHIYETCAAQIERDEVQSMLESL